MEIKLAYGREGLDVSLPIGAEPTVIRKPELQTNRDGAALVRQALDSPVDSKPLTDLARQAKSACILICDITRPVPNHLFLRPMIEDLQAGGIEKSQITVLVATGLHRPNLGDELEELVGDPWVQQNVRVINHYAKVDSDCISLGVTEKHQVPVGLNRYLVEADIKIATGLVEPHFMAGYSGGRKVIAPGVAHHETIRTFHSARFMESPFATSCNLENNPLHDTQLEIVNMLSGPVLSFNTVIDEHRDLAFVSFGEVIQSHLRAVAFARESCEVKVGRQFNTVLTSSAGYPLDKTYYQTVKGMVTPLDILQPGGDLIIASECSEGFGSEEFLAAQKKLVAMGVEPFLESLMQKTLADVDEWQTEMQLKPMRIGRIKLYAPALDPELAQYTGVEMINDLSAAIQSSLTEHMDSQLAVVPEGPYVVPFS